MDVGELIQTKFIGFSTNPNTWLPVNPDYKTFNLVAQKNAPDSQFKFYQAIAELRSWPAIQKGDLHTYVIHGSMLVLARYIQNQKVNLIIPWYDFFNTYFYFRTLPAQRSIYVVVNFSDKSQVVDLTEKLDNLPEKLVLYRGNVNSGLPYG